MSKVKKRYISLSISILAAVVLMLSSTYALYRYFLEGNTEVAFDAHLGIIYNKEHDTLTGTLNEVSNKDEGSISTTIELWTTTTRTPVYGSLSLNVTNISSPLNTNGMLKYEVWSGDQQLQSGNFDGITSGSTLDILIDEALKNVQTFYTVYIWLDKNALTTTSISGTTFEANTSASASQVITGGAGIKIVNNSSALDGYVSSYPMSFTATSNMYELVGYAVTNSPDIPTNFTEISNPSSTYVLDYTVTANGVYYIWFKTNNGMTAFVVVDVDKIDNINPELVISSSVRTSSNISVSVSGSDDLSGVKKYWYSTDNVTFYESENSSYVFTEYDNDANMAYVYVEDSAGNKSNVVQTNLKTNSTVTIRYWYETIGGTIAAETYVNASSKNYGQEYSVTIPSIPGYTTDITQFTYIAGVNDIETDIIYMPIKYIISVFYMYDDTTPIVGKQVCDNNTNVCQTTSSSGKVEFEYTQGNSYNLYSPLVDGYSASPNIVSGVASRNRTYTVIYSASLEI